MSAVCGFFSSAGLVQNTILSRPTICKFSQPAVSRHYKVSPPQHLKKNEFRNYVRGAVGEPTSLKYGAGQSSLPAELLNQTNPWIASTNAPQTPEKLHVREYGNGNKNVIMLHGLSQTGEHWKPVLSHMNQRSFKYICPDLLGHGESSCTPYLKYTPTTHLHYLQRDVTSKLGTSTGSVAGFSKAPFHLVGSGLGAILAIELARVMPSRVLSLHLISLPYYENEMQASEDLLSHLLHPIGQFKLLSRVSSAIISHNDDILKPLIDLTRFVTLPKPTETHTTLPEQLHAYCSTLDECMVKHRLDDSAYDLESTNIRMDIIQGAADTKQTIERVESFYSKHVNSSSIVYVDGATSADFLKTHPEAIGEILTRDYFVKQV